MYKRQINQDDRYLLEYTACDLAGNQTEKSLLFTVNQSGTRFFLEQNPQGTYLNHRFQPKIRMTNLDEITVLSFLVNGPVSYTHLGCRLGTTLTAMMAAKDSYRILQVGDCRVYAMEDMPTQLTVDQTEAARKMMLGQLTKEEVARDPARNVLLQCVGASVTVSYTHLHPAGRFCWERLWPAVYWYQACCGQRSACGMKRKGCAERNQRGGAAILPTWIGGSGRLLQAARRRKCGLEHFHRI